MKDETTVTVIKLLEACSIPYMVGGSYSSNIYGIPREPDDADIVIDLHGLTIDELSQLLEPTLVIDHEVHVETTSQKRRYTARVTGVAFNIEFFILNDDPHSREEFQRRRLTDLAGHQILVQTVEDVLVTKLRWSILGDRPKFMKDVRGVIAKQAGQIDWNYVHGWCKQHGSQVILDEINNGT